MPDGVVQWCDAATGEAAVVRRGRVFAAKLADLEPAARHAGARVRFDIEGDDGAARAVRVTLRRGTRTSPRQHRFGTLAGARRVDAKAGAPFGRPHPEVGHALVTRPLLVVETWAERLAQRDLDGALAFYRSDGVLHAPDGDVAGRSHLGSYLEASPLFGMELLPHVAGDAGDVVARWDVPDADVALEVRCRVAHGQIAEQWLERRTRATRAAELEAGARVIPIDIATRGDVDEGDIDYGVDKIGTLLAKVDEPILFTRLKLTRAADPAREKPAIAQVTVDVDGAVVRAHVAAHGFREAVDLLERRLRDQLEHRARRLEDLRTWSGLPEPGQWRHGDLAAVRPSYVDRPPEERQLVRHKTFAIGELTPDEAAFDMSQQDYDFHLFRDLASGEDAVIERLPDDTYRLTRLHPTAVEPGPTAIALTVEETPPPELTVDQAIANLDNSGRRWLFFADADSGRGHVVYRRYDGHYGLITPA